MKSLSIGHEERFVIVHQGRLADGRHSLFFWQGLWALGHAQCLHATAHRPGTHDKHIYIVTLLEGTELFDDGLHHLSLEGLLPTKETGSYFQNQGMDGIGIILHASWYFFGMPGEGIISPYVGQ